MLETKLIFSHDLEETKVTTVSAVVHRAVTRIVRVTVYVNKKLFLSESVVRCF